eukprot:TRINITY_DN13379_c0_g1_i2.p1 TRINITY_DN13379_c0_g1~~TRINITY_DN13379_c0_g1_i2.p1  ORF type:complete len:476 (-),score=94.64 TRINITY_DN13379_c0_g1_i2:107-1534(-)
MTSSSSRPSGSGAAASPQRSPRGGMLGMLDATAAADVPRLSAVHQDFFRTRLWGPASTGRGSASFKESVVAQAEMLVGPSSSAVPPPPLAVESSPPRSPTPRSLRVPSSPTPTKQKAPPRSPKSPNVSQKASPKPDETPLRKSRRISTPVVTPMAPSPSPARTHLKRTPGSPAKSPVRQVRAASPSPSPVPRRAKSPSPAPVRQAKSPSPAPARPVEDRPRKSKTLKAVAKDGNLTKKRGSEMSTVRSLVLTTVPVDALSSGTHSGDGESQRPQRVRMRPLEHWRNERLIFNRSKGSKLPAVVAVELNQGPKPDTDPSSRLPLTCWGVLQPPVTQVECKGLCTENLTSKVYRLPARAAGETPYTVALQGMGIVHVYEGTLRFALAGKVYKEETLKAGGTLLVRGGKKPMLAAPEEGSSAGVNFQWVAVQQRRKAPMEPPSPVPIKAPVAAEAEGEGQEAQKTESGDLDLQPITSS